MNKPHNPRIIEPYIKSFGIVDVNGNINDPIAKLKLAMINANWGVYNCKNMPHGNYTKTCGIKYDDDSIPMPEDVVLNSDSNTSVIGPNDDRNKNCEPNDNAVIITYI